MQTKTRTYKSRKEKTPDLVLQWAKTYRMKHKEEIAFRKHQFRRKNPEKALFTGAKSRAKKKNMEFNIELCDIIIPDYCPVLGLEIHITNIASNPNAPSLDRIDNSKGYIKGNVRVISWRANSLKKNATIEEIRLLLKDLENL